MALSLPRAPESENIRSLSWITNERITDITGTLLEFSQVIDPAGALLFKNGLLVDPNGYEIIAHTVELSEAAIDTDVFLLNYHYTRPADVTIL